MSGRVVSFFKRTVSRDWSSQELAEFYRVEAALLQAGLRVTLERGVTDEGDPWFVFCRAEDDEVIVHFARIDGRYLISAPTFGGDVTGHDFSALVRDMVARNPILRPARRDENVALHPSALLVMLVASALLKMTHTADAAVAERPAGAATGAADSVTLRIAIGGIEHTADIVAQETQQYTAVLTAIALAAGPIDTAAMPVFVVKAPTFDQAALLHPIPPLHDFGTDQVAQPGGEGGGGSVTPPPPLPPASAPESSSHNPDAASGHVQMASVGGLSAAQADLVAVPSVSMPVVPPAPAAPVADAGVVPITGFTQIAGGHDLANSLLQVLGGNEPILYAATLPEAFVAPLHGSVHTPADIPATTAVQAQPVPAVATSTSGFVAGGPGFVANPVTTGSNDAAYGAVLASAVQLSGPGTSEFAAVLTAMHNFAQVVGSHLAVLVSGNQVVEYDYFAVDYTPAAISAVTYDFADGSHVSLVGLRSELPHTAV